MTEPRAVPASVPVLIVDDNPAKRLALTAVLSPFDYAIVEADSGVAALRAVLVQDFAVILLDVRMPGMDGFETAALIRQRQANELTPIIFVTANANHEIPALDRYAQGAVDFIFSPVQPDELRAKVAAFAGLYRKGRDIATSMGEVQSLADRLRLLTDAAPIGIFQTDGEKRYTYTNPQWSLVTGISAEAAAGRQWDLFLTPQQRAELVSERVDDDSAMVGRRLEIPTPGGESRFVLITTRPLPSPGGRPGWVGTVADVTADVHRSLAREDELKAKDHFLSHVSHELRAPLAVVHQFTSLLIDGVGGSLTEDQQEFLTVVTRNVGQLKLMIDDLLEVGRATNGRLTVNCGAVDLSSVLTEATAGFIWAAKRRRVGLNLELGDLPPIRADAARIQEVITNLIDNALKFTPAGGQITVGAITQDDHVAVTVADTGRGVPPQDLDRIFEQFFQVSHDGEESRNGLGLGLYICKDLIELQGGTIKAAAVLGQGTTITVTLPLLTPPRRTEQPPDRQKVTT
ncbi:ATP-binding protein [Pengzhenrongella phosphoraccumulans]|uniref:sensor histidine kinase n=1 Tax=Pengzhenrongella phosphoraccumulans TaxID=3114394 RepID=UPI003890201F